MIEIIHEDEQIIILNKPGGILVIPSPKNEEHTLTNLLNIELAKKGLNVKAHPCHRLDKDTSGIILYAKGKKNQQLFMNLFHENKIEKKYFAVVAGRLKQSEGVLKDPIEGKPALTIYKTVSNGDGFTSVDIELKTGRTNQIRIHFKNLGHPLLGDYKFAFRKDFSIKLKRLALHAYFMKFIHPVIGKEMIIKTAIPESLKQFF